MLLTFDKLIVSYHYYNVNIRKIVLVDLNSIENAQKTKLIKNTQNS
ncbi:MAG: hypothetical protein IKW16_01745 [Clostridia bacterium]|nr:hypothetical protein [Clostridia bacterium]